MRAIREACMWLCVLYVYLTGGLREEEAGVLVVSK